MAREISVEKIIETHDKIIEKLGGEKGILNKGIIENAISRIIYQITSELKNNVIYAAAVLLQAIVLEHPFIDGNKRTGLVIVEDLLERNDYIILGSDEELERFVLDIARCVLIELEDIMRWLYVHTRKK